MDTDENAKKLLQGMPHLLQLFCIHDKTTSEASGISSTQLGRALV